MAETGGTHKQPLLGDEVSDARLGPAEAHDVIRQRLGPLAGRRGLKQGDVHRLARQMHTHTYRPGEIILPRGVRADCLGMVVQGQVAVHVGQRGAARLVVVLLPGSTFGEMMLAEGRPSHATLQALTHSELRFLRRADVLLQSSDDGETWRQLRIARFLAPSQEVKAGVYACSPSDGRFSCTFTCLEIGRSRWGPAA